MSAYVNIHGQPLSTSAAEAVLAILPTAVCAASDLFAGPMWVVRKTDRRASGVIGTGANEEAAWRDAWSRMLADDLQREAKP